ncbi:pyridoxal phosphate-dependent decarboxylase family protein [Aliikangiella coralliicola]|uniref:PLP-dependent decarboxylase n=1 Tax=Aliikangiella coralliicola TaxID=2592383 RepID=A0A545UJG2_9GAMM|nr:aminotransferase class I/II-fold pyridoxal phosphate-dependent enzyme [Aliikangiella coralliicola]TQV89605.1 PLP-dependent decarboxylase [Aliikangiella coralliicola]
MPFIQDADIVVRELDQFFSQSISGSEPVINQERLEVIINELDLATYVRSGGLTDRKLAAFLKKYLSYSTRLHHSHYFGHQCAAPHYSGALASLVDGFINNPMAVYEMGPAAASVEYFVVNWMLEKVGWQPSSTNPYAENNRENSTGAGVLVNGGSLANLLALLVARRKIQPDVWQSGSNSDLAVMVSSESHYSIEKSAGIMGIGKNSVYQLAVDERGAILPDQLENTLNQLVVDGKKPMILVANACSTALGIYDSLEPIAEFCQTHNIWFHVDAAHGAGALLSEKHRDKLRGVVQADSIIWDAHKMLQTPSLCAALLVKERAFLDTAMHHDASYLFHDKEQPGFDFMPRTIECTKSALGTKFFFVLAALGESGLSHYVDQQCELAQQAYQYIEEQPDLNCPVCPESNILCFRPEVDDATVLSIRDSLLKERSFHLTSTVFNGKRYLRMVFMSPNSSLDDVRRLVERVRVLLTVE